MTDEQYREIRSYLRLIASLGACCFGLLIMIAYDLHWATHQ
jgi:hypothetical protein